METYRNGAPFGQRYVGVATGAPRRLVCVQRAALQLPRAQFAKPNEPTDIERAAAYGSFIAGAGSYTFDGSTLAMKADFRKNPNEMNGDIWRLQAQLQGDRLQLVFVNPPFLPGREYRMTLVRVE